MELMSSADLPAAQQFFAQRHGGFYRGLGVELSRIADLEEHVLHDVGAVGPLEAERPAAKEHVVKSPGLRGEHGGITHLSGLDHQREANGAAGRVSGRPALARTGIGRVAIGPQALTIDPRQRHGVEDLLAAQAKHVRDDSGRGHLDQDDMIEADLVEGIFERQAALYLVGLDHRRQHVAHGQRWSCAAAGEPVGNGENAAEVVRRVAPLGGQPGVVEVEPANHRANVEGGLHRVELKGGARNLGAVGHDGSRHDRAQQFGAGRIFERLETAAQRIDQAIARGGVGQFTLDVVVADIIGNVDEDLVVGRAFPAGMYETFSEFLLGSFFQGDKRQSRQARCSWLRDG